ncbi:MAG: neutral/alkaline non-lysosomal ceramidase N-terminal domain-containing protein [Planctomycetota bacterium]
MSRLTLLTIVVLGSFSGTLAAAEQFQAGAATSNITPSIGAEIIGGFVPYPSKHIHDQLHARCLVLDDGTTKLALVVCDLLGIHRAVSDEARRLITEKTGIPRDNVMISATHTHSATSALGQDRLRPDQSVDEYQQFVARRICDGVICAVNNRRPAQFAHGSVDVSEHVFNRRWQMRPGTVPVNPFGGTDLVKMNPPAGSPNLVEPAGPIDPAVSFLSVQTLDGRPISILSAYSLHYVGGVGAADISSDYYGVYCESLEKLMLTGVKSEGDQLPIVAMMANGTSGDINNINFKTPRPGKKPYEQIKYVAEDLARQVNSTLPKLQYQREITLKARYREPTIAWRKVTPEQKKWAEETIAAGRKSDADLSFIYAQRTLKLADYPETTTIPVQVLRIGNVCIGTMPCEVFCEIGLEFKSRSPIQPAFMIELAHGYFGYLPTPRQMQLGGYETWIGTNRLEPEASTKLMTQLLEMAEELK